MIKLWKTWGIMLMFLFVASCGDDEEANPESGLNDVEFSFSAGDSPIDVPTALAQSQDPNALQVAIWLQTANSMSAWLGSFQVPSGAETSSDPIVAGSARVEADEVLVYTWTSDDGLGGTVTVAYQIAELSDKYTFEVFWKLGEGDFERFIYAEESKGELKNGFMEIYIAGLGEDVVADEYFFKFEWSEDSAGNFTFAMTDSDDGFELAITANADGSGSLIVEYDGTKSYEATWSADGTSGTYATYDFDGNLTGSGTWTA
ncbi:MAG: hypothetical protein KI790_06380 [Cyclobacteriaceae bacterium]|nr:hypothetical protein [Cyclobacteriaceae bacterium HetDA_MAG_MS6]